MFTNWIGRKETMNSKGHLYISLLKSAIRIIGCVSTLVTKDIVLLAVAFGFAELLGVLEELADKR